MARGVPKLKNLKMTSRIIILSIVLAWTLLSINNSINLRLIIIAITILFTIFIRINVSSWYAIILFLIYIGGIIVIFSYFVSLASNDPIITKRKIHFTIIIPIILIKIYTQELILAFSSSQINNLYISKNITILLLITIVLLLIIVIVIKRVKKQQIFTRI